MLTDMNEQILQEAGLTKAEAQTYAILVRNSPCAPPKLADLTNESRTNTYKLLDSLEEKGLVSRDDTQKKLRYWANNPSLLLDTLKKQRTDIEANEKRFQDSLPSLVDEYFQHSEQPSIRYFHGREGVREVYNDQLKDANPLTFIYSPDVVTTFGVHDMHLIRNQFPKRNIKRHVLTPDSTPVLDPSEPLSPISETDRAMQTTRTWLLEDDLAAPVEWTIYGNKLSIVSVGTEMIGMIIESPQIASSFKEILDLLDRKIRSEPGYDSLPKKMLFTKMPEIR